MISYEWQNLIFVISAAFFAFSVGILCLSYAYLLLKGKSNA